KLGHQCHGATTRPEASASKRSVRRFAVDVGTALAKSTCNSPPSAGSERRLSGWSTDRTRVVEYGTLLVVASGKTCTKYDPSGTRGMDWRSELRDPLPSK